MIHSLKPLTSADYPSKTPEEPVSENQVEAEDEEEMSIPVAKLPPEGPADFAIHMIDFLKGVETPYGVRDKVRFTFRVIRPDENGEVREDFIHRSYNLSCSDKSDLVRFLAEIGMPNPGQRFQKKNYLGIIGRAEIKHVTLENGDKIVILEHFSRRLST